MKVENKVMKANELMIGDWVNIYTFPNDNPLQDDLSQARITSLITDLETVECAYTSNDGGIGYASRPASTVLPIPLTPEILEKNGFEVQEQGGGRKDVWIGFGIDCEGDIEVEFQHNIPTHIKIDSGFKGEYYISTNIKFVHQLQHALRLCEIDKEMTL